MPVDRGRRRVGRRIRALASVGAAVLSSWAHGHFDVVQTEAAELRQQDLDAAYESMENAPAQERAVVYINAVFDTVAEDSAKSYANSGTWIPAGTRLAGIEFPATKMNGEARHEVRIVLDLPDAFLKSAGSEGGDFNQGRVTRLGHELFGPLMHDPAFDTFMLYAYDPKTGEVRDIQDFLPVPPDPVWDPGVERGEKPAARGGNGRAGGATTKNGPFAVPGPISGALSGKTVFINQAHGWFDDPAVGRYRVQRGNCYGITEDFSSPEFIDMYVIPMLRNAGAKVMPVREPDLQTNMVIVDNSDATGYVETGTGWSTSTLNGFKQKTGASWVGTSVNPFNQGAGQNRLVATVNGAATATATWTATIPADGYYNVYASWTAFTSRPADAQYIVYHSGGSTEVRVNQQIDGYTWVYLGNFYFEAGGPATERKVVLTNTTNGTAGSTFISADAVRWGGGMGDVARRANGVSGRPRWEEEAVLSLQWYGFGYSGLAYTGTDDESGGWADRPEYAKWEHSLKDGSVEDAIYFAWHTNANTGCGSAARGLSSFRSSTATTASANLQTIMHDTAYAHISGLWFPGWTVRGKNVTNYGENNQNSLGTGLPGFLLEGLFHDNETDATAYGDPQFRQDAARSLVQGVINYFESRDSITLSNPPETPRNLRVISNSNGTATVSWDAPLNNTNNQFYGSAATSYIVYRSANGFGFDNGTAVTGTSTTVSGIANGTPAFFRVAAKNAGGVSFPSETLAVCNGGDQVLIVNGFDRYDRALVPQINVTNAGTQVRVDYRNFQAFNYAVEHAKALAPNGVEISSASNEAVAAGQVTLSNYKAIFWILGEESTANETFSTTEQTAVSNYLATGGKGLFVSGAELAWDLDGASTATSGDRAFLNNTLRADYVGDSAATYTVSNSASGPLSGLGTITFSTASGARYDAQMADRITTSGGSAVALTYSGGNGGTAAISYSGTSNVIVMGFPFETIGSASIRQSLMQKAVAFLVTGTPTPPAAPSGLAATTVSQTQINLTWTDNSSDETGFVVGRSTTNGGPYTDVQTLGVNATSWNNTTGLSANTTYYYVVRATGTAGDSANSAQASATTLPNAPTAPSGLGASAVSQTQINLTWTDNSSNETGFIVGRSTTSGGPYTDVQTLGTNVTSWNNTTGLSANTTYYYVVRATNSGGDSANSAQASATTLPNAPAAPSGLGATTISQTQINLSWTDNSSNETGFIIGRGTASGGPYSDIQTVGAGVTTFNNTTGLSANTTYYYVVRATNTGGDSANSAQASATTLPNAPAAPSGLSATAVSSSQINLTWTDNSSNETGFIVGRSTTSGGPYSDVQTLAANSTGWNNGSLSASTTYYYVVRATNTGGDSANSAQASATTQGTNPHTALETFEGYAAGSTVAFRNPTFSGSTTGVAAGNTAVTTSEDHNDKLDPAAGSIGASCDKVAWSWTTAGTGFIRLTTASSANRPNPALDLTKGVGMYVKLPAGQLDLQILVRETGGSGPIGANAGTTGTIEKSATAIRVNSSGSWQYVYFNIPSLSWTAFTGNGVLTGSWGSLEALAITAVSGDPTTAFTLYIDDIYQGPQQTPIPSEIILDNTAASFSGTWSTGTATSTKYGADYRYCNSGDNATATYDFNVPAAGQWTVQVWYPQGSNRANNAPHSVVHSGGTTNYSVNQQNPGGTWVTLGTHTFAAGGGQVQIKGQGANPSVVMADGVRFVWVGP